MDQQDTSGTPPPDSGSLSVDVSARRDDFPILQRTVGGDTPLIYFDNAATTQTPHRVIDSIEHYYRQTNANVHRGIHQLSQEASIAYEEAHDRLASFIGASGGREEMIFTKNTTEALNLVGYAWGLNELEAGDEVVLTEMEHHASLVTWQQIANRTGASVRYIQIDTDGRLDMEHAEELIGADTRFVSAVHVSNVLGTINPIADLADLAHENDALIFADGAQAVPNRPVDVEDLGVDFYAFSGHKMAGPTGIGCLYGREALLEEMEPFLYGGDMIESVTFEEAQYNELPWKFEAGTPLIAQGIALAEAVAYLEAVGMDAIRSHEAALARDAHERLLELEDVTVYGPPPGEERSGLLSFTVDGIHPHDLSSILNDAGVAIRAGDHCAQPLHDKLGIPASARASFYLYNTHDEIDALLEGVETAIDLFA